MGIVLIITVLLTVLLYVYNRQDSIIREPKIDIQSINCNDIHSIKASLFAAIENDQQIRAESMEFKEFVRQNFANLEVVVNILESCGMPGVETVGKKGIAGIWLIIQHSMSSKYNAARYYKHLLQAAIEENVALGDLALMQDRILVDIGKPQLYGSQIINNHEIYKIKDPECVDTRRKCMGLLPLRDYLKKI